VWPLLLTVVSMLGSVLMPTVANWLPAQAPVVPEAVARRR